MLICPKCQSVFPPGTHSRCPNDDALLYALGDDDGGPREALGPGSTIAQKYELLEVIPHRTGTGRTFKARQLRLKRDVELRILPADSLVRPSDHARFQREVATWGRLRSDHVVRLFDSGFTEQRSPYMVLELVGQSLGDRLRAEGAQPFIRAYTVAEHALHALITAHEAGVLHRDINPDTLVATEGGGGLLHVRLTGFGLAKHLAGEDEDPTAITMTGQVVGNPSYMAPETVLQGLLEPRTDLYALGVTLYELVTGRKPHEKGTLAEMLDFHVRGIPTPVLELRPDCPQDLAWFIALMMHREPDGRFASAEAALEALHEKVARPRPVATVVPRSAPPEPSPSTLPTPDLPPRSALNLPEDDIFSPAHSEPTGMAQAPTSSGFSLWWLLVLFAGGVIGGALWLWLK